MNIAFIAGTYKSKSEQWIWRQADYLKDYIKYIGLTENTLNIGQYGLPLINVIDLPLQKSLSNDFVAFESAKIFFLLRKLYKLEKEYKIDAYYIHYLTNAYLLLDFLALSEKKVFIHCHGYDITNNLKLHVKPDFSFHSLDYLTFINDIPENFYFVANSENTKNKIKHFNISENRISVLKFGVPVEGMVGKIKNQLKILYLGRLVDFKGPDLTIQAFEIACKKGLNAELIIAGEGDLMVTCQLLKKRSAFRERIKLLGAVTYETGIKLRKECHLFTAHNMKGILSNQEEAYGVSIVEAMGAGLPVVTGDSGGIEETVVHSKTGFLFAPGDIDKQADYLLLLGQNEVLRKEMGLAAYEHVKENFSLEKEKKNLLKILQS